MRSKGLPILIIALISMLALTACPGDEPEYPDIPWIDYQSYGLFVGEDELGNTSLTLRINFDFTDGDGNIGMTTIVDSSQLTGVDSLDYNLFFQLYDWVDDGFEAISEDKGGFLKYRIPWLDKQPLVGCIDIDIDFPIIVYDTIFYTFYLYDRDLQRSNIDSTASLDLSSIELDSI